MANDLKRVGLVFTQEGAVDFRKTLQEVNIELNKNSNQFKLVQQQWDESTTKIQKLTSEQEYLSNAYEIQTDRVSALKMQLADLENAENKNTTAIKRKQNELTNAQLKLQTYKDRLDKTSTSLNNAKNGIETTAEKTKRLTNEIKENESSFKLVQSQYTELTSKTQKLKDEQEYLTNAYKLQSEKVEVLQTQLDELESVEDKNTNAISKKRNELIKAQTELNNYSNKLQKVTTELENFGARMIAVGSKIENVGGKIEKVGTKVSTFSIATATALATSAKTAIDFEDAFTGVEKTVDGTAEQMAELKQGIRDMAKSIPSTTTEISAVAEAAGQLGIKTEDILSFTKVMIDLGNSTNLSAEEAASALAKFANITNMSAEDYDRLGSVIVALGNNFATTEADIVQMATKLAATGDLAGLSQAQILALATAMSSVGIEAEAGGSAMSKLLKQIQVAVETGSSDLKDFAKVAGMSSKEFKSAFEKDAVGALAAFISGLNNTKRNGKSAIAILQDMNLTEVRLSNTILSLSNSSEVMNNAIELGNEAWEDNTALTNEANKRYSTLKSKIEVAWNKIKDLAITLGDKLTPILSRATDKIDILTKRVAGLTDKDVEMIASIAKTTVIIGPLITILGKLTSGIGGTIKVIGSITQAFGVMRGSASSTSTAITGIVNVMKLITANPIVAVTTATIALTTAMIACKARQIEEKASLEGVIEAIENQKNTIEQLEKSRQDNLNNTLTEINITEELVKELKEITDENGKVKEGYEDRARYILNELNQALGTEYNLNGNIIESYKSMQGEIDTLISKKKAEAVLNAYQEEYGNALKKQASATENLISLRQQLSKAQEDSVKSDGIEKIENEQLIRKLGSSIKEQTDLISEYGKTITDYENLQTASVTNSAEEIDKAVTNMGISWEIAKDQNSESIEEQIKKQVEYVKTLKETLKEAVNTNNEYQLKILSNQYETEEKKLENLTTSLANQTSTIQELTPEQVSAWKEIASQSSDAYYQGLSNLPITTQEEIQKATGVIKKDTSIEEATKEKGSIANWTIKDTLNIANSFKEEIDKSASEIKEDNSIKEGTQELVYKAKLPIDNLNSENWGEDLVEGMGKGIKKKSEETWFTNILNGFAEKISNFIHFSKPDKGPLRDYEKWMPDMVDGLSNTLEKSAPRLAKTAEKMSEDVSETLDKIKPKKSFYGGYNSSNINNNLIDYNKMASAFAKALTNCKFSIDEDGFARIVKDEIYKVV